MEDADKNQELTEEELADFEKEIQRRELLLRMEDANIAIKKGSGYFDTVAHNAHIDEWRRINKSGYRDSRRKKAEKNAAAEGRTLRPYKASTPERRKEQRRSSKEKQRQDADFAAAEQKKNTAAKQAKRDAMTKDERDEANRIRREKDKAKKALKAAEAAAQNEGRAIF